MSNWSSNNQLNLNDIYDYRSVQHRLTYLVKRGYIRSYHIVSTKQLFSGKYGAVTAWADTVVREIFNLDRRQISHYKPIHFTYIKFGKTINTKTNTIKRYGLVHGISRFHAGNTSDLDFYDMSKASTKTHLYNFCKNNNIKWETEFIIIIIKTNNIFSEKSASDTEKALAKLLNTFD